MTSPTHDTIAAWHELVRTRDTRGIAALLADEVVFHSPVVHTPQVGRTVTQQYLTAAFHVFFNETFQYVREVVSGLDPEASASPVAGRLFVENAQAAVLDPGSVANLADNAERHAITTVTFTLREREGRTTSKHKGGQ